MTSVTICVGVNNGNESYDRISFGMKRDVYLDIIGNRCKKLVLKKL